MPKYTIGGWVRDTFRGTTFQFHDELVPEYIKECIKKWEPKELEWCVFWNDEMKSYKVARFKQVAWGEGHNGQYKTKQGLYYDFIAPLEFIQTLKGI